jgi:CTP synthase (UTP-ammonia lyase)
MTDVTKIALVGEFNPRAPAHDAIPFALALSARDATVGLSSVWVSTLQVEESGGRALDGFDGIWCVPSTPYRSEAGALLAIGLARERGVPFLGTCGGFQYAIVEFARNALQWDAARHAELQTEGEAVVTALECALVDVAQSVTLLPGTMIHGAYGHDHATEEFRCRYAVNPACEQRLFSGALRLSAVDDTGATRAVELAGHPFFVGTLFQPERLALRQACPPLVRAFVSAAVERKTHAQR